MFFRFSFRLPAAVVLSPPCVCVCPNGPGVEAGLVKAPDMAPPPGVRLVVLTELIGVPNRSTPSLAAEMMADPSMVGSKRVEAPMDAAAVPRPRPCETVPEDGVAEACMADKMGLLCWRFAA